MSWSFAWSFGAGTKPRQHFGHQPTGSDLPLTINLKAGTK